MFFKKKRLLIILIGSLTTTGILISKAIDPTNNPAIIANNFLESLRQKTINNSKPFLWVYWENIGTATKMPTHISICRETVWRHCKESFNIVELDNYNIYDYLPELKKTEIELKLNKLYIAHKVDYLRVMLLYKYGGIYLDSDIITMQNLEVVIDKLKYYDYLGFGSYKPTNKAEPSPQNWAMCSRPQGELMGLVLKEMIKILMSNQPFSWHAIGAKLIRSCITKLHKNDYQYYRYPSDRDGTVDNQGKFVSTKRMFSGEKIEYKNIDELLIAATYNTAIKNKFPEKLKQTMEEILDENTNFSFLVKKSLGIE